MSRELSQRLQQGELWFDCNGLRVEAAPLIHGMRVGVPYVFPANKRCEMLLAMQNDGFLHAFMYRDCNSDTQLRRMGDARSSQCREEQSVWCRNGARAAAFLCVPACLVLSVTCVFGEFKRCYLVLRACAR